MTGTLRTLQRLRHLQTTQAARTLAAARAHEQQAGAAQEEIKTTRRNEAHASATDAQGAYATWLPTTLSALKAATEAVQAAATEVTAAQTALAEARAADRAVAHVVQERKSHARRLAQRKAENQ